MADPKLAELAKKMRGIDFAMLFTRSDGGAMAGRPMSNNGDVEYDGDSFYFTYERFRTVSDIEADPKVSLSFQGSGGLLGMRPFFACVEGIAELIRDRSAFEAHWTKDLDRWFPDGIDTPGIVLVKVRAERIHWWDGEEEGEILA
jgi:general stress protein 26